MKSFKITAALVVGLSSQVAMANQPCGNYGISTNQPPCNPQQQQTVVYSQPQQAPCGGPQEQPVVVYAQPPQQTMQQAPAQPPATPRYGLGFGYRARYNSTYGYQQTTFGARWDARRAEASGPDYGRGLDLGIRGIQDESGEAGVGLYLRAHQKGGQQRLGLELSADALETEILTQAAAMLYLNPQGLIKPFGLLGGGLAVTTGETVGQAGVGLDIELGQRLTVTGDIRAVESLIGSQVKCLDAECLETTAASSFLLGNLGVSVKF